MTRKITNIAAAFDMLKPGLAEDFIKSVTERCEQLLAKYESDARKMSSLGSSYSYDGETYRAMRGFLTATARHPVSNFAISYGVDHDRIAKEAVRYADFTIAKFVIKLTAKLADLDDVEFVQSQYGTDFSICGKLNGREVQVDQRQILNWSPKGNPFHQFPALIYVDGKKVSEKQFKELAGNTTAAKPKAEQQYFNTPAQAYRAEAPYKAAGHKTMVRRDRNYGAILYIYPKA